jgi:hypothetical protein
MFGACTRSDGTDLHDDTRGVVAATIGIPLGLLLGSGVAVGTFAAGWYLAGLFF